MRPKAGQVIWAAIKRIQVSAARPPSNGVECIDDRTGMFKGEALVVYFKPESVEHFKQRFVLEKSEREAADFMKELIRKSYSSYSTGIYDQFQLLTNGIPY